MFVDSAEIRIKSGKGGNGAVTFRREPFVPQGGPDGGDGGDGGSVIFVADKNLRTLMDLKLNKTYSAENGQDGQKRNRYGKKGKDLVIKVPEGTLVIDQSTGHLMKDLVKEGDSVIAAKGGKGGRGNVHFKSSVRQAPNFAEAGGEPQERNVKLELKLIADVGLVGLPNAGKSTLLASATSARPKIAPYHFTTIDPNLGVVDIYDRTFVMADIAGIIEGAHQGAGLGLRFLKHIERTKVLLHVVDISGFESEDPISDYENILSELQQYDPRLLDKAQIVAANKVDIALDEGLVDKFVKYVESSGKTVYRISAATGEGVRELLSDVLIRIDNYEEPDDLGYEMYDFSTEEYDPSYREIHARYDQDDDVYILAGQQLSKIFDSTNFNDAGSLRYLYRYIEDNGGIRKLIELGMHEGDTVRIKNFEFEYTED